MFHQKQHDMKNLLLSTSLILITSIANAQNRVGGNNVLMAQSNVNYNTNISNVYSNVSTFNNNPINVSDRGLNNARNVNIINNTNVQQATNKVVRTRPVNSQTRNTASNRSNNIAVPNQTRNERGNEADNRIVAQNTPEINFIQQVANTDAVVANAVEEIQIVQEVKVYEAVTEKTEIKLKPTLNVDITLPKPSLTLNLKVKEEKVTDVGLGSGTGLTEVKSKEKRGKRTKRSGNSYYHQKVNIGTILKNKISKLKNKFKKTKTKKAVFSVVCYKF